MKKLYDKSELTFAIIWIVLYCVVGGSVRGNFGDASIVMVIVLAAIAAVLYIFVKKYHLEETYGLQKWKGSAKDYGFFIPLLILTTGNLWSGFSMITLVLHKYLLYFLCALLDLLRR